MIPDEELEFALGLMDEPRRSEVEHAVAADPALSERLGRLARHLDLLLDDGREGPAPPPGLALRSIDLVDERRHRHSILDFIPVRVPFRWADVAVAAGIFLAGLVTLIPAVHRGRSLLNQATCAFNLRQLGTGLTQYAAVHNFYPYIPPDCPGSCAGSFAILLNEGDHLASPAVLHCPGNDAHGALDMLPGLQTFHDLEEKAPRTSPCLHQIDYAYNLGYQDGGCPRAVPFRRLGDVPLLADLPGHDGTGHILPGNSPNHGGLGQNVLYSGGHVKWHPTRRISPIDDDMFLNFQKRSAPGLQTTDAVLAPGMVPFGGD